MVLPWLDSPVLLHSSRADTCKLTPAQCEYRSGHWRYWYQADHVYGHATIYFMCAVIGVFTITNIISKISKRSKEKASNGNQTWKKALAAARFLSYKGFYLRGLKWYSPSIGVMLLGIAGVVYYFSKYPPRFSDMDGQLTSNLGLTLGPKPYYWPNTKKLLYGGSPPIATRTGWMALALLRS
jgi:hypothetical protein